MVPFQRIHKGLRLRPGQGGASLDFGPKGLDRNDPGAVFHPKGITQWGYPIWDVPCATAFSVQTTHFISLKTASQTSIVIALSFIHFAAAIWCRSWVWISSNPLCLADTRWMQSDALRKTVLGSPVNTWAASRVISADNGVQRHKPAVSSS